MQKERVHCFQSEERLRAFISIYNEYHKTLICMQKDGLQVNESLFEGEIERCSEIYFDMVEKYFDTYVTINDYFDTHANTNDYGFLEFVDDYIDDYIVIKRTEDAIINDLASHWIKVTDKRESVLKHFIIQGFEGLNNLTYAEIIEGYRDTFGYNIDFL